MAEPAASALADYCASLQWSDLAPAVQRRTKELVLDFLGVTLRGSREPSSRAARQVASAAGVGRASCLGSNLRVPPAWAALANGCAGHAVELDDVTRESSLHPGVAIIPAALAVAQDVGARPPRLLEAIVAGYEVTMRVGNALNPASAYARGFHPTGVAGVFGASAASGVLLDLAPAKLANALGIAGSMASGSLEYLADGSPTKRLNAGWAAHAGVVAAALAQAGFGGPPSVFEGRLGVLHAYSDDPRPKRLLEDVGAPPQLMRVALKPYACCRYNHGLIDAALALRRSSAFELADVAHIELGVLSAGAALVADPIERKRAPRNIVDAQFSAPFAVAVALVHGAAGVNQFTLENVRDARIRELMARTDCVTNTELDRAFPDRWPARVGIALRDGARFESTVDYAYGEPENPVATGDLVRKFADLSGTDAPDTWATRILDLDAGPSLEVIAQLSERGAH